MSLRSRVLAGVALLAFLLGFIPTGPVLAVSTSPVISAGDLIRGTTFSAVYYYAEDGFRYVFPNDKTYFTWYENFDDVIMLTDAQLSGLQMGGNVTYRPGSKMIKINSDPKTYQVAPDGILRWVTSEDVALAIYGSDWNKKIDDVPDGFFTNYSIGTAIESISDLDEGICFDVGEPCAYTISDDKGLTDFTLMDILGGKYYNPVDGSTTVTIHAGETVMFANVDDENHTFTADDNSWGTGTLQPLQNFVRRFNTAGVYPFHCSYHPEMTGIVVVEEALTM